MEEGNWQDYALCQGLPTDCFFKFYEDDPDIRPVIKSICALCPVRVECLTAGKENNETGVWGGVYLVDGKPTDL
jgi:hypothetical protein